MLENFRDGIHSGTFSYFSKSQHAQLAVILEKLYIIAYGLDNQTVRPIDEFIVECKRLDSLTQKDFSAQLRKARLYADPKISKLLDENDMQ